MNDHEYVAALLSAKSDADLTRAHEAYRDSLRAKAKLSVWRATIHLDDNDPNDIFEPYTPVDTKVFRDHADACAWAKEQLALCAEHHNIPHFSDITEEFIF